MYSLSKNPKYKYMYIYINTKWGKYINTNTNTNWQARGGIEQDVLESYCWMYSTWNIPKEYKGACSGGDQVAIGDDYVDGDD